MVLASTERLVAMFTQDHFKTIFTMGKDNRES
jgi:hypothetical protein